MSKTLSLFLCGFLLSFEGDFTLGLWVHPLGPESVKSSRLAAENRTGSGSVRTESPADLLPGFHFSKEFDEQLLTLFFPEDVRITVNAPLLNTSDTARRTKLILYALPNGNSTEQTSGKLLRIGEDWHYDIQHIAAQTRFLRRLVDGVNIVTVYLETSEKSWPAWRSRHPGSSAAIVSIVDSLRRLFSGFRTDVVLSGHSGGGSFIFGYINGVADIPNDIERIAFLDANYGYEDSLHAEKLSRWLREAPDHYLCVLAYNDSVALLDGKPFVSRTGGTWHRSHMMIRTLEKEFPFGKETRGPLCRSKALGGRVQFLLMENPERAILHTVQVERNGFIYCITSGTEYEEADYQYFGERAYSRFISRETDDAAPR